MEVRFIYSACVVIETEDLVLCCDPWFTPGAYYGSWYQYPPLPADPVDVIGKVDAIYVSHIHPDHYDIRFLRKYLARYPETPILVGNTDPPYLLRLMEDDGLKPVVASHIEFGETQVSIFPNNDNLEGDTFDTALVVSRGEQSVVNLNDNPVDENQLDAILAVCPLGRPTLALLPHSGAGAYPQTYDLEPKEAIAAEAVKRQQFLDVYSNYVARLRPQRAIPFAGQYWLGGPLGALNDRRGVADATEVLAEHGDISVVLADGGLAFIDLETLEASAVRVEPYDSEEVQRYINALPFDGYDYEKEIQPVTGRELPLLSLVQKGYARAIRSSSIKGSFWFCLKPHGSETYMTFDVARNAGLIGEGVSVCADVSHLEPRCEVFIDPRFLFGLLTRLYHWNNAEIGSHYRAKRVPNEYRREVHGFLNRFYV